MRADVERAWRKERKDSKGKRRGSAGEHRLTETQRAIVGDTSKVLVNSGQIYRGAQIDALRERFPTLPNSILRRAPPGILLPESMRKDAGKLVPVSRSQLVHLTEENQRRAEANQGK